VVTDQIAGSYGRLPLSFEANQGQTDAQVRFLSRGDGYALFLTSTEAVFRLQKPVASDTGKANLNQDAGGDVLRTRLVGANPVPQVVGLDEQTGQSNYFLGNDPIQWQTNVANYGKVEYRDVYRGINLVYYGNQQQLEYDFVVQPGADPNMIGLALDGVQDLTLDAQGNLVVHMAAGDVVEHAPVIYQEGAGGRQAIAGHYVLRDNHQAGFAVAAYDHSQPLIIDPILVYSTYLGGSDTDYAQGIAVDAAGNAYVTGNTYSANFPTTPGAFQGTAGGRNNVFIAKLNASGSALVYSTYLGGGSSNETGRAIAVDSAGNAYVTGITTSVNFPTTPSALQRTMTVGWSHAFLTRLNASGSALVYSTYLGGDSPDRADGIAVDGAGNAYVAGYTASGNFPTTPGAFQRTLRGSSPFKGNAFVAKFNTNLAGGASLLYSTYLGGSGLDGFGRSGGDGAEGIAVDAAGNAYVTGTAHSTDFPTTPGAFQQTIGGGFYNAFVTKVNASGTALVYSSYLGGADNDFGQGIAVDRDGNAYVTGDAQSSNFPTTPGAFQRTGRNAAFVTKVNASGTALAYSTYLGGSSGGQGYGIAVDGEGSAYVTGVTSSADFPVTTGAFQRTLGSRGNNAFVTRLSAGGSALAYSTYLGGSAGDGGQGIALDGAGNAYVAGWTGSGDFPTTAGAFQRTLRGRSNAFVAKVPACRGNTIKLSVSDPGPVDVGSPFAIRVSAQDVFNNTDPFYRCTVHFSSGPDLDPPQARLPADYTFTAADAGTHTWTNGFTLFKAGSITITVTDTADPSVSAVRIVTVRPGEAKTLELSIPALVTASVSSDLTVTAKDQYGNLATGYHGTVYFTSTDDRAELPDSYPFVPPHPGRHTWNNGLTMHTAGLREVTVTDTVNPLLTSTANVLVAPGPASKFIIRNVPPVLTAGVASDITVTALDRDDNTATGYRGTVHFTSSDGAATLPGDYRFQGFDDHGHTWFNGLTLRTAGHQTVTVTDTVDDRITGIVEVVVNPAAATRLVIDAPTTVAPNVPFDVTVTAVDSFGNIDVNYGGTVHFTSSDGAAILPGDDTFAATDNGIVTFSGGVTLFTEGDQILNVSDTISAITSSTTVTVSSGGGSGSGGGGGSAGGDEADPFVDPSAQTMASALVAPRWLWIPTATNGTNRTKTVVRSLDRASVDRLFTATAEANYSPLFAGSKHHRFDRAKDGWLDLVGEDNADLLRGG
jgi:hypothetical protein